MELTSSQPIPTTASPPMTRGLTEAEAVQRRAAGKGNNIRLETSRTYWQIIRDNIFTFLNMVLFSIGAVLVLLGLPTDAFLSVGIALLNVVVGVVQEFRAKRLLDKIALLTRPKATVLRDTVEKVVDPNQIVLGDWLIVHPGDQIVVDGRLVEGKVDVDESLLTGESDLIPKQVGDTLYSGSFVVNGSATFEAEKVGAESFANQLTASARTLKLVKTPLQMDVDMVVRLLVLLSVQLGILFGMAMIIDGVEATESARQAAVIVGLIPNGLFFMVTIAYAMGTVRMAGKGALIQQSNAVESMSNVNVLCLDKTGTLTANRIGLHQVQPFILSESEFRRVLGIYAHSGTTGNRTSEALALACPGESRPFVEEVPFSSARKWSALSFDQPDMQGVYVLGAPEMLRPYLNEQQADFGAEMSRWIEHGYRVLLLAQYPEVTPLHDSLGQPQLPPDLIPVGILSFSDELRAEAESTLKGFSEAGIRLKIISGDNPQTVLALAKQAGLRGDIKAVSGLDLEEMTEAQLGDVAEQSTIFGRITPHQKERLVDALKRRGHYVAMIGDGVNDVLSLKKAHIGIAMQSGTQAARGVADIILMNDSFAALPPAFREGQRIVSGMQDIMRLFLARVLFQTMIIVGAAIIGLAFPVSPVHQSLLSLLTVGIPTLFLAAWARPAIPRFRLLKSVMHFVIPAGFTLALLALVFYSTYILFPPPEIAADEVVSMARTVLNTLTVYGGLMLILFVEPQTPFWTGGDDLAGDTRPVVLTIIMGLTYAVILLVPGLREFFQLHILRLVDYAAIAGALMLWGLLLRWMWRAKIFTRFLRLESSGY
ncbi:MAG TPA: HAD-IC family P-type ATPase [Aggregatilineales bacterium]|nr:HAD-IC family P-type ATPase [Aggregatilineales bacterium]